MYIHALDIVLQLIYSFFRDTPVGKASLGVMEIEVVR